MLFYLVSAMQPRMFVAFDTDIRPLQVSVRVGQVRMMTMFSSLSYDL